MTELSILAASREATEASCLVHDGLELPYAEVASRVASAMVALRDRGVRPGQRVALTPRPDVDSAVWLYALFELGCPAVLLHPRLSERERMLATSSAEVACTIDEPPPTTVDSVPTVTPVPSDRILAIVYTSGSRGVPRGAQLSRRAFLASARAHAANLGWRPDDRWLLGMPLAHIGGLSILTRSLIARSTVVLAGGPFDARTTIEILERERVTLASVVPTMLRRLLDAEPEWVPSTALRAVLVGGAPFPEPLRRRAVARGVPVLATYGCTEACSQVTTQAPSQSGSPGCGAPLTGIEARIVDGEIRVRGSVLMDGYLGDDVAPLDADGWLRTGDAGRFLPDGQLDVLGRLDDLIITGGENVAPAEVEAWLESVPGIEAACVFAIPDDEWGQSIAAALVTDANVFRPDQLEARMRTELASYKQPRRLAIVEAFPLNASGKVDRAALARHAGPKLRAI